MNKRVLITGATSNIGISTALAMAKQGFDVTIVARNYNKIHALKKELAAFKNISVDYIIADLSLMDHVRKVAKTYKLRHNSLDILINQGGMTPKIKNITIDGFEYGFATNYLAFFLLTNLLLPELNNAKKSRVITFSSIHHKNGMINFDDIMSEKSYSSAKSYAQSKLANILFTYELARKLKGTNITSNCLHPGIADSNFGVKISNRFGRIFKLLTPFLVNIDKGAETPIFLATDKSVENITGHYFVRKEIAKSVEESYDEELAAKLWSISEELCNVKFPF